MLRVLGGNQEALRRHLLDLAALGGKMIVIVPEQYTLQTERELMDGLDVMGFFDLEVLSPSRLTERVFAIASLSTPDEWIKAVTGEGLNVNYYLDYLESKFTRLYDLQ